MNILIRQLKENDWRLFKQVRLKALQTDPQVFGSNYERESQYTEEDWKARLRLKDSAVFMLFSGETPIGLTGVSVLHDDPTKKNAIFWGSWIEPDHRAKGLSEMLYQARIEWARRHPSIENIIVAHRASNLPAKRTIQKYGFVFKRIEEKVWTDGKTEGEVWYELSVK